MLVNCRAGLLVTDPESDGNQSPAWRVWPEAWPANPQRTGGLPCRVMRHSAANTLKKKAWWDSWCAQVIRKTRDAEEQRNKGLSTLQHRKSCLGRRIAALLGIFLILKEKLSPDLQRKVECTYLSFFLLENYDLSDKPLRKRVAMNEEEWRYFLWLIVNLHFFLNLIQADVCWTKLFKITYFGFFINSSLMPVPAGFAVVSLMVISQSASMHGLPCSSLGHCFGSLSDVSTNAAPSVESNMNNRNNEGLPAADPVLSQPEIMPGSPQEAQRKQAERTFSCVSRSTRSMELNVTISNCFMEDTHEDMCLESPPPSNHFSESSGDELESEWSLELEKYPRIPRPSIIIRHPKVGKLSLVGLNSMIYSLTEVKS